MAKSKDTPNLPASSRLQPPSTSNGGVNSAIKETAGMAKKGGTTAKVMAKAKSGGMKGSSPYGTIC